MLRRVLTVVGFVILGHLLLTQSVEARSDYRRSTCCSLDAQCRDAADAEDWIERGRASVTDSPVFRHGIRLTARAVEEGEEFEPGLASAIYRFIVPDWAHYVKIGICYRDASEDDGVAGRLWIKTVESEAKGELDPGEGDPFYGDTFVLRSDQASETIYIPAEKHAEDGELELHIVAEGKDCLDVECIRVEYLEDKPADIAVVRHFCDDYWYRWPRHRYVYHHYYWGPCYWPRSHLVYERWDWPWRFYWTVWRPWFRLYVRVHCRYPWWGPRRYTVIYHRHSHDPPARKRALFRKRLKERHVWVGKIPSSKLPVREKVRGRSRSRPVRDQEVRLYEQISPSKRRGAKKGADPILRQLKDRPAQAEKRQEKRTVKPHTIGRGYAGSQRFLRSKPRSVRSFYGAKERVGKQSRLQRQPRTAPQIRRPQVRQLRKLSYSGSPKPRNKTEESNSGTVEIRKKSTSRTHVSTGTPPAKPRDPALARVRR